MGAGIAWKNSNWHKKCLALDNFKEIFNAELFTILEAFKIAIKVRRKNNYISLTIFSDSQTAILRILKDKLSPRQTLAVEIIRIAKMIIDKGVKVFIRWVLSHINIKGNEKADFLAKKAVNQLKFLLINGYSFFSYINWLIRKEKLEKTRN